MCLALKGKNVEKATFENYICIGKKKKIKTITPQAVIRNLECFEKQDTKITDLNLVVHARNSL